VETFFSSLNHIGLICAAILLVFSEIGYPGRWFGLYLPMLGPESTLYALGAIQVYYALNVVDKDGVH
jgi:hypothetical protein